MLLAESLERIGERVGFFARGCRLGLLAGVSLYSLPAALRPSVAQKVRGLYRVPRRDRPCQRQALRHRPTIKKSIGSSPRRNGVVPVSVKGVADEFDRG